MSDRHSQQTLVKHIKSAGLITIPITGCVAEALSAMAEHRISSVVVTREGSPCGLLTEKECVALPASPETFSEMPLSTLTLSGIHVIGDDDGLFEAYHAMVVHDCTHLLTAAPTGELTGIVSETDVMSHLTLEHFIHMHEIRQIMSTRVETVDADAPLHHAVQLMRSGAISCLIIVDDTKKPTGIVTSRDIVRRMSMDPSWSQTPCRAFLKPSIITIGPHEPVFRARELMHAHHVRHLPVVDDGGRLVGVVTERDVVKGLEGKYVDYLRQLIVRQRQELDDYAARLNEKRVLERLLAGSHVFGLLVLDTDKRAVFCNPTAANIFGCGTTNRSAMFSPQPSAALQMLNAAIDAADRDNASSTISIDADDRNYAVKISDITDHDGAALGHLVIAWDNTALKRLDRELRRSRDEIPALAETLETVRENESARIARELHDDLGQTLTALSFDTRWLRTNLHSAPAEADRKLESMQESIRDMIKTVQNISTNLHPPVLEQETFLDAVQWLADRFENTTGMPCEVDVEMWQNNLPPRIGTPAFRIVQEALTNIARHAHATHAWIRIRDTHDNLTVEIEDDGRGFDHGIANNPKSLGLRGMRERAALIGGELRIDDAPECGTLVCARFVK